LLFTVLQDKALGFSTDDISSKPQAMSFWVWLCSVYQGTANRYI